MKDKQISTKAKPSYGGNSAIHLALVNAVPRDHSSLIKSLKEGFYSAHRSKLERYDPQYKDEMYLYKPTVYYIFGKYDLAFMTLIDDYGFAQKPFLSLDKGAAKSRNYSFQIHTGIPVSDNTELISDYDLFSLVAIVNVKLNNLLILNNRKTLVQCVITRIENIRNELGGSNIRIFISKSFSWFDLNIVVTSNNQLLISEFIIRVREMNLMEIMLPASDPYNSLISRFSNPERIQVAVETLSLFGVNYEHLINDGKSLPDGLKLELEWQVFPGYLERLLADLKKNGIYNSSSVFQVLGKSDFHFKESKECTLEQLRKLYSLFIRDGHGEDFGVYLEGLYTRILLPINCTYLDGNFPDYSLNMLFEDKMDFKYTIIDVSKSLKALQVSDHLRNKVVKLLANFNHWVKDAVLSAYFVDVRDFMLSICKFIEETKKKSLDMVVDFGNEDITKVGVGVYTQVSDLEYILEQMISTCEQAMSIRLSNSYNYEDFKDQNVDFNSSIQQLISMYNTLAKLFAHIYYGEKQDYVVVLNNFGTKSNLSSIAYDVNDFLHPEFILVTLAKEVGNGLFHRMKYFEAAISQIDRDVRTIIGPESEASYFSLLNRLIVSGIWDLKYLFSDLVRFGITCNFDPDQFNYWSWFICLKNSSNYGISGPLTESAFIAQAYRNAFTLKSFGFEPERYMKCPNPELRAMWESNWVSIMDELSDMFSDTGEFKRKCIDPTVDLALFCMDKIYAPVYGGGDGKTESIRFINDGILPTLPYKWEGKSINSIARRYYFLKEDRHYEPNASKENILFKDFERINYQYLYKIYEVNFRKTAQVNYQSRSWRDGEIARYRRDEQCYYYVTRTGSVYFQSMESTKNYFFLRNNLIDELLDVASRYMNEIIK